VILVGVECLRFHVRKAGNGANTVAHHYSYYRPESHQRRVREPIRENNSKMLPDLFFDAVPRAAPCGGEALPMTALRGTGAGFVHVMQWNKL
jgi:hypothetical protein